MDLFGQTRVTSKSLFHRVLFLFCCGFHLAAIVLAQNGSQVPSAEDRCVGVFLNYAVVELPQKIHPYNTSNQPYKFESNVTLTNLGYVPVSAWEVSIDFQFHEVIAQADGVLFLTSKSPPGLEVGNDTRIVGVSTPGLLTSIDTAEDETLISTGFGLVGTEFGVSGTQVPLPANIRLVNDGYSCSAPLTNSVNSSVPTNEMWVCCTENRTQINQTSNVDSGVFARQAGDVVLTYDIMSALEGNYWAQVSIEMEDPIGRIDNWNLTWRWTQGEFINEMKGAQIEGPNDQDLCVYGIAGATAAYSSQDFSTVMSCSPNPVIIDLTPDQVYDPTVSIPFCCRNGTLLPDLIDPAQSKSNFQLQVMKLPPNTAREDITPPLDWNIAEDYNCTQPLKVSPTEFYPAALHSSSAVASWQVVCNKTVETVKKCCVSFSSYYNDSLIPCPTCSCGCPTRTFPWNGDACNVNIPPMLLPYNAAILPPSNRTALAQQLAKLDHYQVPTPFPCPDNCGVNINWHVYSDYTKGWSSRITILNWDKSPVVNWSAAIQMPVAMPGFQNVYSFNGSKVPDLNNTLFMQGRLDYDNTYLLGADSKDHPGKLQSILSFDKRKTPGINVVQGDGYPKQVWFNGEECTLPTSFPAGNGWRILPTFQFAIVVIATIYLMGGESMRFL